MESNKNKVLDQWLSQANGILKPGYVL